MWQESHDAIATLNTAYVSAKGVVYLLRCDNPKCIQYRNEYLSTPTKKMWHAGVIICATCSNVLEITDLVSDI